MGSLLLVCIIIDTNTPIVCEQQRLSKYELESASAMLRKCVSCCNRVYFFRLRINWMERNIAFQM